MRSFPMVFCCCAALLVIAIGGNCLTIDTSWTNNFWFRTWDSANCIQETFDGGFIIAGVTRDNLTVDSDVLLIKTDSIGGLDWSVAIGDTFIECGYHVLETYDGGYLVSASSSKFGDGNGSAWFIKTDASGDTLWTYAFSPEDRNGFPLYGTQRADSGYAFTGLVNLPGDFNDSYILLLDKDGSYEAYEHWGGYAHQDGCFITEMPDNGFIVAGTTNDPFSTQHDFRIFRTNSTLGIIWDSTYVLSDFDEHMFGACKVGDGIVAVGLNRNVSHALKVNFSGNTVWSESIEKVPYDERPGCICPTEDGGYVVGGWVGGFGNYRDYLFTRLDSHGDTIWTYMVGGPQNDHGRSLVVTSDGGYAMVGTSTSWVSGSSVYLVKIKVLNTSAGASIEVPLSDEVTVTFENVTSDGETELSVTTTGPALPTTMQVVPSEPATYYDITSTALFDGTVEICIIYDEADITTSEAELSLMHFDGAEWQDITSSRDMIANVICGTTSSLSPFVIAEPSGSVAVGEDGGSRPLTWGLHQNYPNPFNPSTAVRYSLARAAHVRIDVYTVLGQKIATLVDKPLQSGTYLIDWGGYDDRGDAVASGLYIYRIVAGEFVQAKTMMLLR